MGWMLSPPCLPVSLRFVNSKPVAELGLFGPPRGLGPFTGLGVLGLAWS